MKALTRYFRKYSRAFLLVFMSLLLVIFLIGDVIGRRQNAGNLDFEVGTAFGAPVRSTDIDRAEIDISIARRFGLNPPQLMAGSQQEQPIGYYLIMEEARRTGVYVGRGQVEEALRGNPQSGAIFDAIVHQQHISQDAVFAALGRVIAVFELAGYQMEAVMGQSLPRMQQLYRDQFQQADARVSAIDTKAFLPQVPEPTEAEMLAHFNECKDRPDAHTESTLEFGYRIPDRIVIEYLTVDPKQLQSQIRVSEKEVRRYFDEHAARYTKPADASSPLVLDQNRPQTVPMTFEEAKDRAKEDCRAAKAIEEAQRVLNEIQQAARTPWDAMTPDKDGVRPAPAESAIVAFSDLQSRYSGQHAVVYYRSELVDSQALSKLPGFGTAQFLGPNRQRRSAVALAFNTEGLHNVTADPGMPRLRVGEPAPIVQTFQPSGGGQSTPAQAFVFRVVQVSPSGPPASLDEVRAKVIENLKRQRAQELAGQYAEKLAERARQVGLEAAVAEAAELKTILQTAESSASQPTSSETTPAATPAATYVKDLEPTKALQCNRRQCYGTNFGYSTALSEKLFAATTQPAAEGGHHIATARLASQDKWAVGELLKVEPLYEDDFKQMLPQIRQYVSQMQRQEFMSEWFDVENITRRTGFVPKTADAQ